MFSLRPVSKILHCVKSVYVWSYSGQHFHAFGLNTKDAEYLSVFSPTAGKCGPVVLIMKVFLSAKVISELYIRTFVAILIVIKFLKKRNLKVMEMVTKMQIRASFSKPDASKHLLIAFGGLRLKKKD